MHPVLSFFYNFISFGFFIHPLFTFFMYPVFGLFYILFLDTVIHLVFGFFIHPVFQ